MNERVNQLATEVGISVEYLTNTKQWTLIEALAELIVRECADVASGLAVPTVALRIKQHFGVES